MIKKYLYLITFLLVSFQSLLAQENENTRKSTIINGSVGVTNNGISLVPNFSLEQPAAIFNLSLAKNKFSIEPEISFSLEEGRPWYQLYWLRYKILDEGKFKLRTGAHLGLNFVKILDAQNNEAIKTERYLVGELAPSYSVSKNISLGIYYMLARGFDIGTNEPLHFLTLNANFTDLKISKTLLLEITPQVYFLSSFGSGEGYYATSNFKISKMNFPLSISANANKPISTDIAGKSFLWNLTLIYSFGSGEISKQ